RLGPLPCGVTGLLSAVLLQLGQSQGGHAGFCSLLQRKALPVASIQKKGEAYYCQFLYQGRRRTVTVGKVSEQDALAFGARTEELLGLLARGRLALPQGVQITDFVLADGRVEVVD